MATELINIRLEKSFLKEIDSMAKRLNFQSRTELIRHSLRATIEQENLKAAVLKLRGSSKTHTTDEELEEIRERVGNELFRKYVKDRKAI